MDIYSNSSEYTTTNQSILDERNINIPNVDVNSNTNIVNSDYLPLISILWLFINYLEIDYLEIVTIVIPD